MSKVGYFEQGSHLRSVLGVFVGVFALNDIQKSPRVDFCRFLMRANTFAEHFLVKSQSSEHKRLFLGDDTLL